MERKRVRRGRRRIVTSDGWCIKWKSDRITGTIACALNGKRFMFFSPSGQLVNESERGREGGRERVRESRMNSFHSSLSFIISSAMSFWTSYFLLSIPSLFLLYLSTVSFSEHSSFHFQKILVRLFFVHDGHHIISVELCMRDFFLFDSFFSYSLRNPFFLPYSLFEYIISNPSLCLEDKRWREREREVHWKSNSYMFEGHFESCGWILGQKILQRKKIFFFLPSFSLLFLCLSPKHTIPFSLVNDARIQVMLHNLLQSPTSSFFHLGWSLDGRNRTRNENQKKNFSRPLPLTASKKLFHLIITFCFSLFLLQ